VAPPRSVEGIDADQIPDLAKIARVSGDQGELVDERRCRNDRIRQFNTGISSLDY
jgi:hypothetical protein